MPKVTLYRAADDDYVDEGTSFTSSLHTVAKPERRS